METNEIKNVLDIVGEPKSFRMDSEIRDVFIHDLIRFAAQDKEKEFDDVLALNLLLHENFFFHITYSMDGDGLSESTEAFGSILHLAAYHFADKYSKKIALRMMEEPLSDNLFQDEAKMSYALASMVENGLKSTLQTLLNNEKITEKSLLKTYFIYCQEKLVKQATPLLANDAFVKKVIPILKENVTNPRLNDWHMRNITNTLCEIIKHDQIKTQEDFQEIFEMIWSIKTRSGYGAYLEAARNQCKEMLVMLAGKNFFSPDNTIDSVAKENKSSTSIRQGFGLSDEQIEKIYELRKEYLSEKLKPAKEVGKTHKI